jgi:membrane-bound lytic murein transglycosylase B
LPSVSRLTSHRLLSNRWVGLGAAVVVPVSVAAVTLLPTAAAHTRPTPEIPAAAEPTPPAVAPYDPSLFAAAERRAPASAPLARLPVVDISSLRVAGIPHAALAAYVTAARGIDRTDATCHLRWWLLAGIGFVESGHAASGGSSRPGWNGIAHPGIYGPMLDGRHGFAAIQDTDGGRLDGSRKWDRAVGPLQFLPSTWRTWGAMHGRMLDPQDIRAAASAAAGYLCAGSADLATASGLATAVFSYNHSFDYVRLVLSVAARYAGVDPASLGVNRLPHDAHRAKRPPSPSPRPTTTDSATSTPMAPTGTSPAPAPSPSASASTVSPAPTPTGGPPSIPPLPTAPV